ncbi:unnamed protein product [Calypogeia fissa]
MVTTGTETEEGVWDVGKQGDHSRARQMVTIGTQTGPSPLRLEGNRQLLPGIPDAITLDHIVPKLPWWACHLLACVSWSWKRVVRIGEVYDAGIRSSLTETLVLMLTIPDLDEGLASTRIALYSKSDKRCCQLPPFPKPGGVPVLCQFVVLDDAGVFRAQANFHRITELSYDVYDDDKNTWSRCIQIPFLLLGQRTSFCLLVF